MKKARKLLTILLLLVPMVTLTNLPVQGRQGNGFQAFYTKFRAAVRSKNKTALKSLMAPRFSWSLDGEVSRDEAFKYIGQVIGWDKFWLSANKAVARTATRRQSPYCENCADYHAFAAKPFPLQMLFQKDRSGNWYWTAVEGD